METVKKNLRSVLLSKVGGVPLKNVERDYKTLVGERLNWRQFGFQSFEAFLNEIPDVVKVAFHKDAMHAFGVAENMSYINPTARKAQFKENKPKNETTCAGEAGEMSVYFGNLPPSTTEEALLSFLNGYLVKEIQITELSSGTNAWVNTTEDVGKRMCAELHRKRYDDRTLKVEPARKKFWGGKKRDVPAQLSARKSSDHSPGASVTSDGGDPSSLRIQSSKDDSATESLNSVDAWSKRNGVGGPHPESCQPRRSPPDVVNGDPAFAYEAAGRNYAEHSPRPSSFSGLKDSTNVSEVGQLNSPADYGQHDSDYRWNSSSEPPPLVTGGDWEEFQNGTPSKCFNSQRSYSSQTRDEPPPLISREQLQRKNRNFGSASYPSNAVVKNEKLSYPPNERGTYNLYVKNIPVGTTVFEIQQLFKNAVDIVELSVQSCFVVFKTFQEVEDACRRSWTIRGERIIVDVDLKHKHLCSEQFYQSTSNEDQLPDLCTEFESLTCTVGSNNERTVQLLPTGNTSNVSPSQATSNSSVRENFQQRSPPMADMPPLVSRADRMNSRVNVQQAPDNAIPPLLSMEDLLNLRANQVPHTQRAPFLPTSSNTETSKWDFPASKWNDTNSRQPCGVLNSQGTRLRAPPKVESSKPFQDFSDFHGGYQATSQNGMQPKQLLDESNSRQYFPKSSQAMPSEKQGNSSEIQNSTKKFAHRVVKQQDHPNACTKFQPSSDPSERGDIDRQNCTASHRSQLPIATTSSESAPSVQPLKPIPDEMRLKELQRMLMDTFPGDTLPTSYSLPEVVDIIIICAVPGFGNSFFWGQLASGSYKSDLMKMYELNPQIEARSDSLILASAALRRGTTNYGEDWCRVWIKQRGETTSTVFFIDFGNFETVSNDNIYELPEEFWKVRPTALPFRVLDSDKLNISEHINQRVTAKVNKKCQRGCIFEIYDLQAQS